MYAKITHGTTFKLTLSICFLSSALNKDFQWQNIKISIQRIKCKKFVFRNNCQYAKKFMERMFFLFHESQASQIRFDGVKISKFKLSCLGTFNPLPDGPLASPPLIRRAYRSYLNKQKNDIHGAKTILIMCQLQVQFSTIRCQIVESHGTE